MQQHTTDLIQRPNGMTRNIIWAKYQECRRWETEPHPAIGSENKYRKALSSKTVAGVAQFLLLAFASCGAALAEHPSCNVNHIDTEGPQVSQIRLQMQDEDNASAIYTGHIYADDPTYTSKTDVVAVSGSSVYTISGTRFGTGTKNLQDGKQHILYFSMDTHTMGVLKSCNGSAWPYKYITTRKIDDYTYPLYTSAVRGATPANLGVVANVSDPYSIGTSGFTVCTVNGTAIKDDGVVGYYVKKYGIPCAHVHTISVSPASEFIAQSAMTAAYSTLTPSLGSGEQFLALGWMFPTIITNITTVGTAGTLTNSRMSVAGFFTNAGAIVHTTTMSTPLANIGPGDFTTPNSYFQSSSTTPFSNYGLRPAMMLAWAKCNGGGTPAGSLCSNGTPVGTLPGDWAVDITTAKKGIDAAFAARDTNPMGGDIYLTDNTGDISRSVGYLMASPAAFGNRTAVAPSALNVTVTGLTNVTSIIAKGILGYELASPNPGVPSAPGFVAPGTGYMLARTSASGELQGTNQAPGTLYLLWGAAFSCGSGDEPYGLVSTKYPEMLLLMSGYTRGMTAVEAVWKATKQPFSMVCVGDPLASPFSATANTASPTIASVSPSTGLQGHVVPITITGTNFTSGATVSVTGTGVTPGSVAVASGTSITATLTIASNAAAGTYNVSVATSAGTSNSATFTVNPAAPSMTSISASSGSQGHVVPITITGTNFTNGATVNVTGTGVTPGSVTVASGTSITATLTIASNAVAGTYNVSVVTSAGTSNSATFTVNPAAPSITGISASSGSQGQAVPITITGTNFVAGATIGVSGTGVTAGSIVVVSGTTISATLSITLGASSGAHSVTVVTGAGTSNALSFTVNAAAAGAPTITAISPISSAPGKIVQITITGTNFVPGAAVGARGIGVTQANFIVVSSTQMTAVLTITANAVLGDDTVTVRTSAGTSNGATFTVH